MDEEKYMKNKKKILGIVLLILLALAVVILTKTSGEKNKENTLSENEIVDDKAEIMEEQREETQGESQEEEPVVQDEENQATEETESSSVQQEDEADAEAAEKTDVTDKEENTNKEDKTDVKDKEENNKTEDENTVQNEAPAVLPGNLKVCEIGKYIGSYVEDGSDDFVDNVMMIVLENQGNEYIQLANIKINDQYVFGVTTLFPGEKVMVLEKNRSAYVENMEITSVEVFDVALFQESPTMCEETLKIEVKDGMMSVENISGKDFPGGKVFFKTVLDDRYLGGITYFSSIPKLEKGQAVKLSAGHFQEGRSKLLFVTHAE